MSKKTLKLLLVSTVLIITLSCAPGAAGIPAFTPDPNSVNTAIAGTFRAALTQTAQSAVPIPASSTPSMTKAPLPSPFPTYTFAVLNTLIRVSKNTNCRAGPGEAYDKVGALLVGEFAEAVGRSADARYWIIHNPDHPGKLCWLSSKYATVTGVAGALQVFTPPPTRKPTRTNTPKPRPTRTPETPPPPAATKPNTAVPPPDFGAFFSRMESCAGTGWWVNIQLTNTGGMAFQSISMVVTDTVNNAFISMSSDEFTNTSGCGGPNVLDNLSTGAVYVVSSPAFNYDLTGVQLQARLNLCTGPGQTGSCATRTINFTP